MINYVVLVKISCFIASYNFVRTSNALFMCNGTIELKTVQNK